MPYERVGAQKASDHWVRSPLLNLNRACQPCHAVPEKELEARVLTIQDRHHALLQRAARAATDMLDAIGAAKKGGASEGDLKGAAAQQRKAQWRLDFVAAENSRASTRPRRWRAFSARSSTTRAWASSRRKGPPGGSRGQSPRPGPGGR